MADETKLTAATRLEKLLDNIAGGDNEVTPATRLEKFLSYIAEAMEEGGGSGGCECELPTYLLDPGFPNLIPVPLDGSNKVFLYINGTWTNIKSSYNYDGVNGIYCAVEKPLTNNAIYMMRLSDSYQLVTEQIVFEGGAQSAGETSGFYFTEACTVLMVTSYFGGDMYVTFYTDAPKDSVVYVDGMM